MFYCIFNIIYIVFLIFRQYNLDLFLVVAKVILYDHTKKQVFISSFRGSKNPLLSPHKVTTMRHEALICDIQFHKLYRTIDST